MATIVWPGVPGEAFVNDTDKILYQLICSWVNTCGACASYHLAVAKWWGKFHNGCCCISIPVYPNAKSRPYEDWHDIVEALPPDQQSKLVGSSNFKLIEAGVVKWEDVVTSNRVRLLREVVSRSKLSLNDLTDAGIPKGIAEKAHASVNTADHILARQHRADLVNQLEQLGVPPKTIADMLARGLTQRIGLGGHRGGTGPGAGIPGVGPQTMPPAGRKRDDWIRLVLGMIRPPAPRPTPRPTVAAVAKQLGVTFTRDEGAGGEGYTTVLVDVGRVDADLATDPAKYVAPGGTGAAIGDRYEQFKDFLAGSKADGTPIEQPRLGLDADGVATIPDGRHRWAVLRDMGVRWLPVTVPADEAAAIREKYGAPKAKP